jgi:hypothetical protein
MFFEDSSGMDLPVQKCKKLAEARYQGAFWP